MSGSADLIRKQPLKVWNGAFLPHTCPLIRTGSPVSTFLLHEEVREDVELRLKTPWHWIARMLLHGSCGPEDYLYNLKRGPSQPAGGD